MTARFVNVYWPLVALWAIVFLSAVHRYGVTRGIATGAGIAYTAALLYITRAAISTVADGFNRFTLLGFVLTLFCAAYLFVALVFDLPVLGLTVIGVLAGVVIWLSTRFLISRN